MSPQPMIVGRPVLVVVDYQYAFDLMEGGAERLARAERIVAAARAAGIPVVFFQEVHRASGIDFGRELDGAEDVHCLEGDPTTDLVPSMRPLPGEFHIVKRRYSGFYGTEFEIVLRALKAETLILIGGLTDVCIHYTFADAHQRDFFVRVVGDCVGGSSPVSHLAALDAMEYLQAGAVLSTDQIVEAFGDPLAVSPDSPIHIPMEVAL